MNKDFWMNKRVLITGHNGFKGCWLTKWLDMLGAYVIGFSLPAEDTSGFDQLKLSDRFVEITGDIRNKRDVEQIVAYRPQIVIHLAAQAIVGIAQNHPLETFETNLMGTVHLLETLRQVADVKAIVVVTSDKVYENREIMEGYQETDKLMGSEPYSCSKVCEEQAAKAYYESYFKAAGVGVATARASNAYGGGDYHFDRLIPYLEQCAIKHETPSIRNPQSVRPWQYVLDLLHGYLLLAQELFAEPEKYAGSFNFGPNESELYTVGEMADLICGKQVTRAKQAYYEAGLLQIDSQKSKKTLGWKPYYNIKQGLEQTGLAYRHYAALGNTSQLYADRILEFERKLEESLWNK